MAPWRLSGVCDFQVGVPSSLFAVFFWVSGLKNELFCLGQLLLFVGLHVDHFSSQIRRPWLVWNSTPCFSVEKRRPRSKVLLVDAHFFLESRVRAKAPAKQRGFSSVFQSPWVAKVEIHLFEKAFAAFVKLKDRKLERTPKSWNTSTRIKNSLISSKKWRISRRILRKKPLSPKKWKRCLHKKLTSQIFLRKVLLFDFN